MPDCPATQPPESAPASPAVAVLIPVHNGGPFLEGVLDGLAALPLTVWVVDDGSTDDTASRVRSRPVRLLRLPIRSGKGTAIRHGLARILGDSSPEWVLFMDADGQHRPEEVPRFLSAMEGEVDFLIGSRMGETENFPLHRLRTNRVGSTILRLMSGHAVPDTQCGFRALRAHYLRGMRLESKGFEVETEMLLKALRAGARWRPVPVSAVYDGQGSHFRPVADTYRICMAALRYVAE